MRNSKFSLLIIAMATTSTYVSAQDSNQHRKGGKPPSVEVIFSQMDHDQDNQLSEEELEGPLKKDFSAIDTNSDGYISMEELNNAPKPKKRPKRPNNRQQ